MKQDLREALPKARNPPFYFKEGKNKPGFMKPAPEMGKRLVLKKDFELESGNGNVDGQTKRTKKRTNKQTELHQFRKEPSYDGDLSLCQV